MSQYTRPGSNSPQSSPSGIVLIRVPGSTDTQLSCGCYGSCSCGQQNNNNATQVLSYVHNQGSASSTWTINHNLNFYPNVTIQDSGGTIVEGEIAYTTRNTLIATFSASFSGKAYLS